MWGWSWYNDGDNDKANCDDDADGGSGNSKDDGNQDCIFENWCVDGEGGDKADDGDEQTESVASGLTKCSGSSKLEMTVGEMQWGILKETQRQVDKSVTFIVFTISKSSGYAVL